jgi:hypothetical protein
LKSGGEMKERGELGFKPVKSRKKSSVMFKKTEETFYFMAFFIKLFIDLSLYFSVLFRGDNNDTSFIFNDFYDFICVITFIRQNGFRPDSIQQSNRLRTVVAISAGDDKFQRIAERIANGVDF